MEKKIKLLEQILNSVIGNKPIDYIIYKSDRSNETFYVRLQRKGEYYRRQLRISQHKNTKKKNNSELIITVDKNAKKKLEKFFEKQVKLFEISIVNRKLKEINRRI